MFLQQFISSPICGDEVDTEYTVEDYFACDYTIETLGWVGGVEGRKEEGDVQPAIIAFVASW